MISGNCHFFLDSLNISVTTTCVRPMIESNITAYNGSIGVATHLKVGGGLKLSKIATFIMI